VDSVTVFMMSLVIGPRIVLICVVHILGGIDTIKQMQNWCKNNNEKWF